VCGVGGTVMRYANGTPTAAVACVFAFWSAGGGTASISTRVGSSSPATFGSACPFTFGSSLSATFTPALIRSDWLSTIVPSARFPASVMSNEIETAVFAARFRLRMSSRPAPLVPPFGFVLEVSAPGGIVPATSASDPGTNTADEFITPRSSVKRTSVSGTSVACRRSV
jgi:hypothetical protein